MARTKQRRSEPKIDSGWWIIRNESDHAITDALGRILFFHSATEALMHIEVHLGNSPYLRPAKWKSKVKGNE